MFRILSLAFAALSLGAVVSTNVAFAIVPGGSGSTTTPEEAAQRCGLKGKPQEMFKIGLQNMLEKTGCGASGCGSGGGSCNGGGCGGGGGGGSCSGGSCSGGGAGGGSCSGGSCSGGGNSGLPNLPGLPGLPQLPSLPNFPGF